MCSKEVAASLVFSNPSPGQGPDRLSPRRLEFLRDLERLLDMLVRGKAVAIRGKRSDDLAIFADHVCKPLDEAVTDLDSADILGALPRRRHLKRIGSR